MALINLILEQCRGLLYNGALSASGGLKLALLAPGGLRLKGAYSMMLSPGAGGLKGAYSMMGHYLLAL